MSTSPRTRRSSSRTISTTPTHLFVAVLFFCVVFLVIYATYLSDIWAYEGVNWQDPPFLELAIAFIAIVATGATMPRSMQRPSDFCLWIIYTIVIVPSAFLAEASNWLPQSERLPAALGICAVAVVVRLITAPNSGALLPTPSRIRINFWLVSAVLLAITYGWLISTIGIHHTYISFADIYAVRADYKQALAEVPALAYLLPLSYACINPALIVWGVLRKDWVKVLAGIGGDFLIYLASGARLALLSVPLPVVDRLSSPARESTQAEPNPVPPGFPHDLRADHGLRDRESLVDSGLQHANPGHPGRPDGRIFQVLPDQPATRSGEFCAVASRTGNGPTGPCR